MRNNLAFFVAPHGSDTWSGTMPEPAADRSNGPFATVARARDAIRELKREKNRSAPVRVLIRGGVHFLPETLTFTPADSGTATAPITYAAYPGEAPVLSGGCRIGGWQPGTVNGKACWQVVLPDVAAGRWSFTQLFVNGARRQRPRLPREGHYRFTGLPEGKRGFWYQAGSANYAPGDLRPDWRNRDDVEITALQHWFDSHLRIKTLDEATHTVTFQYPAVCDLADEAGHLARYSVMNVFEALENPGEWYLDRPTGTLYYLPLPGETPDNTEVMAPRLDYLVKLAGTHGGAKVRHLRFENLEFRHAEWRLPVANTGAVQAAFNVTAAVVLQGAEHCVFCGCTVANISQYAIEVRLGSRHNRILGCHLYDLGGGGVKINPESALRSTPKTEGPNTTKVITGTGGFDGLDFHELGWGPTRAEGGLMPGRDRAGGMFTEVADCRIHDAGRIYHSSIGVWIGDCGWNYVHHNEIFNLYYTAVSAGWNWSYASSFAIANRIEHNHLHHIGQGLLSDMGAIYLLGLQPGATVRGNRIHDVSSYGYGGWGIYTDQGSTWVRIEDNVVYGTKSGGFHQHYGRDNVIRHNLFALARDNQVVRSVGECVCSFILEDNIITNDENGPLGGNWSPLNVRSEHNLFWRTNRRPLTFAGLSFADWQAFGHDRTSLVADPLFFSPETGDFALRDDSPALKAGVGPRGPLTAGPRFTANRPADSDAFPRPSWPKHGLVQSRLELGAARRVTASSEDYARLAREPGALRIPQGKAVTVSLGIENYGKTAAKGRIRLQLSPASAGVLSGNPVCEFALAPGEWQAHAVQVALQPGAEHVFVESVPESDGIIPNRLLLQTEQACGIRSVGELADVAAVAAAVAGAEPLPITSMKRRFAEARLALAGSALALELRVPVERNLARGAFPWTGSCLEVFGAMPGTRELGQLFLIPTAGGIPAAGMVQRGSPQPEPRIQVASEVVGAGYVMRALVPLEFLRITPGATAFLLELALSVTPVAEAGCIRPSLFGAANAYANNSGYGRVTVTQAESMV